MRLEYAMIADYLKHADTYANLSAGIAKGLAYLRETDFGGMNPGTYEIDGKDVYAIIADYMTKPLDEGFYEVHRDYIDIQYVYSGVEQMGIGSVDDMSSAEPYNPETDFEKLHGTGPLLPIKANTIMIFFPQDAHMPGICFDQPELVRKVVVKVKA
jgi:YhcH/YjgK/YiaL family protein